MLFNIKKKTIVLHVLYLHMYTQDPTRKFQTHQSQPAQLAQKFRSMCLPAIVGSILYIVPLKHIDDAFKFRPSQSS